MRIEMRPQPQMHLSKESLSLLNLDLLTKKKILYYKVLPNKQPPLIALAKATQSATLVDFTALFFLFNLEFQLPFL